MQSALVFLFVLSLLVVVHEFGHFLVARLVGIRVEKFSIGFGPVLFGRKFGDTEYCFSLLPLGGYVKLAGESPADASGAEWEFDSKPLFQKTLVVLAGPLMNAALAFVLFAGVLMAGQPTLTSRIGKVLDGSPAKEAGLLEGDKVIAVNGAAVLYWEDLLREIHKNKPALTLEVERGSESLSIPLAPRFKDSKDLWGKPAKIAFIGVAPSRETAVVKSGFFEAVLRGAERVVVQTSLILVSLWLVITGTLPFKDSMTGPIGIFFMTQQAAELGVAYLFYFMGSLSVSLFVLNLLPIPVLDGGHLFFMLLEKLKGSPLKDSVKEKMTRGGLAALLALMAFVILQDLSRFSILENITKVFRR